ncbi:hypothetical protein MAQ5080_02089 [Marinomonas aquimarina]|uniref:Lipoprotein n=1 Tax=Marinomonas aquimarina TaxID=295068 RepID=A0A1A8TGW5_9GAMM|nr:hypothetical protein [Marinomonas aquimarina]SBS31858.1 hypothetical protein MAQ5080_02089 [Marinomonas aquimarina]
MSKHTKKLVMAGSLASAVLLSGCSNLVTDHGLDYQSARSSDVELQLPAGRHDISDKMIIPNEDRVATLEATGEFETPRAPKPYESMAYVPMIIGQYDVTLKIPASLAQSQKLVTDYFSSFSGEEVVFQSAGDNQLVSEPLQFESQSGLSKLWSNVTRLKPTQYRLAVAFEPQSAQTITTIQLVAIDPDGAEEAVDLTLNEATAGQMVDAWSYISKELTVETALLSKQGREAVQTSSIWTNREGKLALYLGRQANQAVLDDYIRATSGLHITNEEPKELSLVPQDKLARVGDIIDFKVPLGVLAEDEEVILFKVRRRNLDDVEWTERSYPYQLIRQREGYFLTVDASATENPTLTSYRILSLLAK